jgi:hypothetical protein
MVGVLSRWATYMCKARKASIILFQVFAKFSPQRLLRSRVVRHRGIVARFPVATQLVLVQLCSCAVLSRLMQILPHRWWKKSESACRSYTASAWLLVANGTSSVYPSRCTRTTYSYRADHCRQCSVNYRPRQNSLLTETNTGLVLWLKIKGNRLL